MSLHKGENLARLENTKVSENLRTTSFHFKSLAMIGLLHWDFKGPDYKPSVTHTSHGSGFGEMALLGLVVGFSFLYLFLNQFYMIDLREDWHGH